MGETLATENQATKADSTSAPVLKLRKKSHGKLPLPVGADASAPSPSDPLPLGELRSVPLAEIVVDGRARKELGDLKGLARSIAETGLAQPPLVDARMRLVCGYRRYKAAESLGWREMPVRILDIEDPLALMAAEDACRKDLTASEKCAVAEAFFARAKDEKWRKAALGGRLEEATKKGRLDEEVAALLRLSRETLRKMRQIHRAAEEDGTHFADLVARLDEDGRVDRHFRELERRRARGDAAPSAAIVVRPGWDALFEAAEARDVAKYVRASLLAAGAEAGTVLLMPSSVRSLGEAAGLLRQCGFEWRATLDGPPERTERLWLVGASGKKAKLSPEAIGLLAEGCAKGADAALVAADTVVDGAVRALDLTPEEGE